jgi:LCP family protein required for cell wall assembly
VNDQTPAPPEQGPPEYTLYRSRRRAPGKLGGGDMDSLRRRLSRFRDREPRRPGQRHGITPGRVLKWVAVALLCWIALSALLFFVSAQTQEGVSDSAKSALSGGGSLFSGSTILVLGSDARKGASIDESQQGPSRADTIMLVHAGFGSVRKLSIPRDSEAEIPGHGTTKINAAYALGGSALMIRTVEGFLGNGVKINHLVEVDFEGFPKFIDAVGGVTVDVPHRICSPPFDNFWKGLNFKRGEQHLNGERALGYARVRKNPCAPSETDIARAERQQQVISALKSQITSVSTFLRLPWAAWRAPRAVKTDLKGPGLLALALDAAAGTSDELNVLEPSCLDCGVDGSLVVSDGAKADAVRKLEGKD